MKKRFLVLATATSILLTTAVYAADMLEDDRGYVMKKNMTLYAGYPLCSDIVKELKDEIKQCFDDWEVKKNPVCGFLDHLNEQYGGNNYIIDMASKITLSYELPWDMYLRSILSDEKVVNGRWVDGYVSGDTKVLRMEMHVENWQDSIVLKQLWHRDHPYWYNTIYLENLGPESATVKTVKIKELIPVIIGNGRFKSGQHVLSSLAYLSSGSSGYHSGNCWALVESLDIKKKKDFSPYDAFYSLAINEEINSGGYQVLTALSGVRAYSTIPKMEDGSDEVWASMDDESGDVRWVNDKLIDVYKADPLEYGANTKVYHLNIPETLTFYAGESEKFKILVATGFNEKVPEKDELVSTPDGSEMVP